MLGEFHCLPITIVCRISGTIPGLIPDLIPVLMRCLKKITLRFIVRQTMSCSVEGAAPSKLLVSVYSATDLFESHLSFEGSVLRRSKMATCAIARGLPPAVERSSI